MRVTLIATLALAGPASAQSMGDPAQQKFGHDFIAAIRAKEVAALTRLVHPASRACMNPTTRAVFDQLFTFTLDKAPVPKYTILEVIAHGPGANTTTVWAPQLGPLPVRPTHQVNINVVRGPKDSEVIIREIALWKGAWYDVLPCPTADHLRAMREMERDIKRARPSERDARVERLAAAVPEPLLSELRQLIAQGRRIEALEKYQKQTGADMGTAFAVITSLELRPR